MLFKKPFAVPAHTVDGSHTSRNNIPIIYYFPPKLQCFENCTNSILNSMFRTQQKKHFVIIFFFLTTTSNRGYWRAKSKVKSSSTKDMRHESQATRNHHQAWQTCSFFKQTWERVTGEDNAHTTLLSRQMRSGSSENDHHPSDSHSDILTSLNAMRTR